MRYILTFIFAIVLLSNISIASTLYWFTGAGIKKPAEEIAELYNKTHSNRVVVISGGSGQVVNQMIASKTGDVCSIIDFIYLKNAIDNGIIAKYTKILKISPGFIISKPAQSKIKSIKDLAKPGIRIAIGNPKTMTLGLVFEEFLKKLPADIRLSIKKNVVVECLNALQITGYVKSATVDAGIAPDKALTRKLNLKFIPMPSKFNIHRYGYLAQIKYSKDKDKARQLYNFILRHLNIYKEYGFTLAK